MSTNKRKIGIISLFSGCGGLDLGFSPDCYDHISAIDNDSDSIETLKLNSQFNSSKIRLADITQTDMSIFREDSENYSGPTVIIGGAPCQPFSKNGYWISHKKRMIDSDPRNLLDYFVSAISIAEPSGFLFENVESILHPTNRNTYFRFIEQVQSLDYDIKQFRVNAQDYGCPQRRKRVFVLGTKGQFRSEAPPKTHAPAELVKDLGLNEYTTVGEAISKYGGEEYFEQYEITSNGKWSNELRAIPPGNNYLFLTEKRDHPEPVFEYGTRFWNFLLKLHPLKSSWTIPANPGPWIGPFHWTSRRLRVPEIAAIQSFPENYNFSGSRRSIQRQIGNAVPRDLASSFSQFLYESIA